MDFDTLYNSVNKSYQERAKRDQDRAEIEKRAKEENWGGFEVEASGLEKAFAKRFKEFLGEIGPIVHRFSGGQTTATIEEFRVDYDRVSGKIEVMIDSIKTSEGRYIRKNYGGCPHHYIDALTRNPRVIEFMRKYDVRDIEEPENQCDHLSR